MQARSRTCLWAFALQKLAAPVRAEQFAGTVFPGFAAGLCGSFAVPAGKQRNPTRQRFCRDADVRSSGCGQVPLCADF